VAYPATTPVEVLLRGAFWLPVCSLHTRLGVRKRHAVSIRSFFSFLSSDLAIDLGTANTLMFAKGKGIVVNEPSIIALSNQSGEIAAVGNMARDMVGRTPTQLSTVRPLRDGVIADCTMTEHLLSHFIQKVHRRQRFVYPRVIVGVPSETTQVERRAVVDAAIRANAREVHLVPQPVVAAMGAGLPVTEPTGNLVLDIGGGTTDVAVIALAGIVYARSLRIAGDAMDNSIADYVKHKHNLLLGEHTAEAAKIAIGSAAPLSNTLSMEIKGRCLERGLPKTVTVTDADIREALEGCISAIVNLVKTALERTPPELCADIADHGIVVTGGCALLRNLDTRISRDTGVPVSIAEDPLTSVIEGTGRLLSDPALLRRLSMN
jgi:rod shape-determining protein MreB and related proteins